tara:strand:- start:611 stop:916 length:306 start_codon:yes stop_codon:yes gene_type:complete
MVLGKRYSVAREYLVKDDVFFELVGKFNEVEQFALVHHEEFYKGVVEERKALKAEQEAEEVGEVHGSDGEGDEVADIIEDEVGEDSELPPAGSPTPADDID